MLRCICALRWSRVERVASLKRPLKSWTGCSRILMRLLHAGEIGIFLVGEIYRPIGGKFARGSLDRTHKKLDHSDAAGGNGEAARHKRIQSNISKIWFTGFLQSNVTGSKRAWTPRTLAHRICKGALTNKHIAASAQLFLVEISWTRWVTWVITW